MIATKERYRKVFEKAVAVLGSEAEARRWMREPAVGLNQQTPSKLVRSSMGADLVETYLDQIEHGVYV